MTLQILQMLENWNELQQREFLAVDCETKQYYRVTEVLGNWGESRFLLRKCDTAAAAPLTGETVTISPEQILHPRT